MSRPIPPNPPRWRPNPNPSTIHVPGLDTNASVLDQIEQTEQLITIKLQNIDENFAKIHNVLANKILPAVRRYAVGTEPVREAAKFWTSFYEQAAQIRIPTYDEYSSVNDQPSHSEHDETRTGQQSSANASTSTSTVPTYPQHVDPSIASSAHSSFFPAQVSTPAPQPQATFVLQHPETPSWTAPMESPPAHDDASTAVRQEPRDMAPPVTPPKVAGEESFEGLPVGMSPPVMMSPARPPRSSAELGLGQTPTREAARRIGQDLINDLQRRGGAGRGRGSVVVESSMSTVPTPPSLSRYRRHDGRFVVDTSESTAMDSSLESMMRKVGLNMPGFRSDQHAIEPATPINPALVMPSHPVFNPTFQEVQEIDSDSDSSDEEVNNTAHPSAAFLMASRAPRRSDESFGSSNRSSDSLSGDDIEGLPQVHPFAGAMVDDEFEDSLDADSFDRGGPTEETLFGVPPDQRLQAGARPGGEQLRILGEHLLQDTIGIGSHMVRTGRVEESPTPAPWPGTSLG